MACLPACTSASNEAPGGAANTDGPSPFGPAAATCTDGKTDGSESDVDCGGTCPQKCKALGTCTVSDDCAAGLVCAKNTCASIAATNLIKDGTETDVDCGGDAAPPCEVGQGCVVARDCKDDICTGKTCAAPLPTDGVENGNETDVDCGGGAPASPCADAKACKVGSDCTSKVCAGDVCQAAQPTDKQKNGNETDVDCGGGGPACEDGKGCLQGPRDCESRVCVGNVCQVPTSTDGEKNGDERIATAVARRPARVDARPVSNARRTRIARATAARTTENALWSAAARSNSAERPAASGRLAKQALPTRAVASPRRLRASRRRSTSIW